jgi:type VI secretion system protein ImpG
MSEDLLPYFHRELAFLRTFSPQFAKAHPKVAGRLQRRSDAPEDPHVERLIEGFAFLNARIRHKLDEEFPEISDSLLQVLYPHYQRPLPSMAIVKFSPQAAGDELRDGLTISPGTLIETDPIDGEPCRFRTCYPVTLLPIAVEQAALQGRPFDAPAAPCASKAKAVLKLRLAAAEPQGSLDGLNLDRVRFFLKGQAQHVFALYELLLNCSLDVAALPEGSTEPVLLGSEAIQPVGLEPHEGLLPYPPRSFPGFRLLSEYFAFVEKFLFFDLHDLKQAVGGRAARHVDLFFYLNRLAPDLEQSLSRETFQLGCTPIVNLFEHRADPIRLTHTEAEYRVVPDSRHPMAMEVYSIDRVASIGPDGEEREFLPFYAVAQGAAREKACWHATRRSAVQRGSVMDSGTEVYLSLVDPSFTPHGATDQTLDVEITCLNRDLPHRLPFGGGQPRLHLPAGGPALSIECLTPPTRTYRPPLKQAALWQLTSHLSLQHFSLADPEKGTHLLRELLTLYDFTDSAETRSMIEGVLSVRGRRVIEPVPTGISQGLCRGLEITIDFDEGRFSGSGVFLLANVLERFLGYFCSINTFCKLVTTTNQREGVLKRWPARSGKMVLGKD